MGYVRLFLALAVMAGHYHAVPIEIARWSIVGFYILAGYFGTQAMVTHYRAQPTLFFISRYVRIWPAYIAVFILSGVILLWWTPRVENFGLSSWGPMLAQAFAIYMPINPMGTPWVITPSWMLPFMFIWWAAIALGISRNKMNTCVWFIISLVFMISVQAGINSAWYNTPLFASLPFSIGALAYWLRIHFPTETKWSALAGSLSFPLFLSHYLIGQLMRETGLNYGWGLFWVSLPIVLGFSWLVHRFVEKPFERYRRGLKNM